MREQLKLGSARRGLSARQLYNLCMCGGRSENMHASAKGRAHFGLLRLSVLLMAPMLRAAPRAEDQRAALRAVFSFLLHS
eukprot:scaffold304629_cov33-Tisochrysis_lutea.AAC.1